MNPTEDNLITLERFIIIASLVNAALFYLVTIFMFIIAKHTRLNWALALQKFIWLMIIVLLALPSVLNPPGFLNIQLRVVLWVTLAVSTWLVLYEVYRANWPGPFRENVRHLSDLVIDVVERAFRRDKDKESE